jgi:predicted dehydrogenase
MAEKIRFGILGCGGIGRVHAEAIGQLAHAELVAAADARPEASCAFAAEYGLAACESYEAMLARDDVDAVTICTPSGQHAAQGILAAQAGKHVLSEKPLDVYVEKVDALIAACQANGVTLGAIFQTRMAPAMQQAKRAIAEGYLGDIVYANGGWLCFRGQDYYDSSAWRGTWEMDAGVLTNQAIHAVDRLIWLTGMQPTVVGAYCPTLHRQMEAEDLGVALLQFPNGAGGVIQGTTLAYPGLPVQLTICGTKGTIVIENMAVIFFQAENAPEGLIDVAPPSDIGGAADPKAIGLNAHLLQIDDFARALLEGRQPTIPGEEGRNAVALINEIYRAANIGPWKRATVEA